MRRVTTATDTVGPAALTLVGETHAPLPETPEALALEWLRLERSSVALRGRVLVGRSACPRAESDSIGGSVLPFWDPVTQDVGLAPVPRHLVSAVVRGSTVLLVTERGLPLLWDLHANALIARGTASHLRPRRLCVSDCGTLAATISKKGIIGLWEIDGLAPVAAWDGRDAATKIGDRGHTSLHADGRLFYGSRLGAYHDHFVDVLDLRTGVLDEAWTTKDELRTLFGLAVVPGTPLLAILVLRRHDRVLEIWDVRSRALVAARLERASVMAATSKGKVLVAEEAGAHATIRAYRIDALPGAALPEQPPLGRPRKRTSKRLRRA